MGIKAIILAAGKGSRMKSNTVKLAHKAAGKQIVQYVLDTVLNLGVEAIYPVVGYKREQIEDCLNHPLITVVEQKEALGTGHAVMQVEPFIEQKKADPVLILAGDCPLIRKETLEDVIQYHQQNRAAATVITTEMDDPAQYGRILRDTTGQVIGIKEAKDCNKTQLKIKEINTGAYCVNADVLFEALKEISTNNAQGEYYLTDIIEILNHKRKPVMGFCIQDPNEVVGVNTRSDLANVIKEVYRRNAMYHMLNGVTLEDPDTTFIDSGIEIGADTIIEPFTKLKGACKIGSNVHIGSHSVLDSAQVEGNIEIPCRSYLIGAKTFA